MKFVLPSLLFILLIAHPVAAEDQKPVELETDTQKLSYALGLDLGAYFKNLGEEIDLDVLHQGVKDSYMGNKPMLSAEDAAEIQQKFAQKQQEEQVKKTIEMITKNKQAAEDFLNENKTKEGVKTTESGLQYKVMTAGDGDTPQEDDVVRVHYKGTLLDGTEFDSSYSRNEPAVFPLNRVIPGWTEALQLMKVGSKYEIFLPPDLAYGDRGAPPVIEPGSMLIFEVELLGIESGEMTEQ
ncbi:MAG: FKBP-type peptidyl-prolyl cis-trans isomerase [Desulfobulbaceae bacterium]|nr:FKBP-type peptidyl-prolyl cis-trans isomerase [Desulfobulbaceae bacterium]